MSLSLQTLADRNFHYFLVRYSIISPTAWSRGLLKKKIVPLLVKKFPAFCVSEGLLLPLQGKANCPYPEPYQSSPRPQPISRSSSIILFYHLRLGLPSSFFPSGFPKRLYAPILALICVTCNPPPTHFSPE